MKQPDRLVRTIASTSALNLAGTAVAAVTGLFIARLLGPSIRGDYAAITAWYGATLVAGELGQPAAICYFVAHEPDRAADYVTTSRHLMLVSGALAAAAGWFVAPHLSTGTAAVTFGYRLMFAMCPVIFAAASYSFALQGRSVGTWAVVRTVQPVTYLLGTAALIVAGRLGLRSVLITLVLSTVLGALVARAACHRCDLTGGQDCGPLRRGLLRYGMAQILATTPTTVNLTLDELVLSQSVPPASLGRYAIAVSLTMLAYPVVSPIGSVLFPRLAAQAVESVASRQLQYRALVATAGISATAMGVVALTCRWVIPTVFGASYRPAITLVWVLSPGGVLVPCNQVMADLLRGRNETARVGVAQGGGAIITVTLLLLLVPPLGAAGAAITSDLAYAVTCLFLLRALVRSGPRSVEEDTASPLGAPVHPERS